MRSTLVTVACSVALAACASQPALTLDAYADAAAEASSAYVTESQDLSLQYQLNVEQLVGEIAASGSVNAVAESVVVMRTETTAFLALLDDAMDRYIDAMDALVPPSDIAEAHAAYVEAMASVHAALPVVRDAVADAASLGDIESALVGSAFADGQPAWIASCGVLEQAARDLGRGIDLKCQRSEVAP